MKWKDRKKSCEHNGLQADPKKVFKQFTKSGVCLNWFGGAGKCTEENCPKLNSGKGRE